MVLANEETESLSQLRTLHHLVTVKGNVFSNNYKITDDCKVVSHLWREHFYRLLYSSCDTEKDGRRGKRHSTDKRE